MVDVEVDAADGKGGFSHEFIGESQHSVEDIGALGEGVDKDVGGFHPFRPP